MWLQVKEVLGLRGCWALETSKADLMKVQTQTTAFASILPCYVVFGSHLSFGKMHLANAIAVKSPPSPSMLLCGNEEAAAEDLPQHGM